MSFRIKLIRLVLSKLNYYSLNESKNSVLRIVAKMLFNIIKRLFLGDVLIYDHFINIKLILKPAKSYDQMYYFLSNLQIDPDIFLFLDRYLKKGMTILDAGANIGLYSLFFCRKVGGQGNVISFEPFTRTYDQLRTNFDLNGFSKRYVYNLALSDKQESLPIFIDNNNDGENSFIQTKNAKGKQVVNLVRLDEFWENEIQTQGINNIDLIKIDVEGWEPKVLNGMTGLLNKLSPIIVMEFNGSKFEETSIKAYKLLDSLGFACLLIRGNTVRQITQRDLNSYRNQLLDFIYYKPANNSSFLSFIRNNLK